MLHDRWNPRVWLRNAVSAAWQWLMKPTPAELAFIEKCRAELLRAFDAALNSYPQAPAKDDRPQDKLH